MQKILHILEWPLNKYAVGWLVIYILSLHCVPTCGLGLVVLICDLNTLYKLLEKPTAHVGLLFADFSSTFNTVQTHLLAETLISDFHPSHQATLWILDFFNKQAEKSFH